MDEEVKEPGQEAETPVTPEAPVEAPEAETPAEEPAQ
jgi:hypothetical protein